MLPLTSINTKILKSQPSIGCEGRVREVKNVKITYVLHKLNSHDD